MMCNRTLDKGLHRKLLQYTSKYIYSKYTSRFNKLILFQHVFKLPSLSKRTNMYLKRWFTVFVKTQCFLELDYARVLELLSSSDLHITSEIEVFGAAGDWLSHNPEERNKHALDLLLEVRFPLLSDVVVESIVEFF